MSQEMGVFEVMFNCRAMRRLSGEPIPEEHLLKMVEAAGQAATGSNTQRNRWIIVRDEAQKKKLADLTREASEAFDQGRIDRGESLPHHDAARRKRMLQAVMWLAHHMHEIHALMVACYQFDAKPSREDMQSAHSSVWPGVQNLLLSARALGLGTVLITLATDYSPVKPQESASLTEILDLPEEVTTAAIIPIGYPKGNWGRPWRKPWQESTQWDRWKA